MTEVSLVAGDAAAGARVARLLRDAEIDIVPAAGAPVLLLVLSGTAADRVEAIRAAAGASPDATVVATLPDDAGNRGLRRALLAGADGLVLDGELELALVPSIRAVGAGQLAVPARLRREIAPQHLSHREKEVLSLVAVGFTNRQIADRLFLAESTVKTHLASVFTKIGASSRAEAAAAVLDPDAGLALRMPELTTAVATP